MFSIQRNLLQPTQTATRQDFYACFADARVKEKICEIRRLTKTTLDPDAPDEVRKKAERERQALKKGLPGMLFQATFVESKSKKGVPGRWRKQSAAQLNGLYMCDFDHVENPRQVYADWGSRARMEELGVLLAYVTPSGLGLKLVAMADAERGNLIDNARWLASQLGMETDEACKDASRLSFISTTDDILYINDKIFTYDNKEFERKYGDAYRTGDSSGNLFGADSAGSGNGNGWGRGVGNGVDGKTGDEPATKVGSVAGQEVGDDWDVNNCKNLERDEEGNICFEKVPYRKIVEEYVKQKNGDPGTGTRHAWLLSMARNFRYICDFDKRLLLHVLMLSKAGTEVASERGIKEIQDIVTSNISQPAYAGFPKYIRMACEGCGINLGASKSGLPVEQARIDYAYWWKELEPLLDGGYKEAVRDIDDFNKLGGVLTAGAMFGTYLTKCYWYHYDGNPYRLSYIVYVIGNPASGKSFAIRQDKAIMKLLRDQDAAGRAWEQQMKEEQQKRQQSSKEAKKDALPVEHPVIRYVPSSISNAVFYKRSMDAKAEVQGREMHLHLYTMESELATALRAQVGSWAGKHDIELKSFQNEYAGVDFANAQSTNGIIQCNWNQVMTSTMDGLRKKLAQGDINDGFVTRLSIWVMPNNDYKMIDKSGKKKTIEEDSPLEKWGAILQDVEGEIDVPELVDYCYDWCKRQCDMARLEDDELVDYFRKRVPIYMMRYTIPRIVMREYQNFRQTGKWRVQADDLKFAKLIGDYLMYIQIYLFGSKIEQAKEKIAEDVRPRIRKSKFAVFFESLGETFTIEEFERNYSSRNSAKATLSSIVNLGIVERISKGQYRKLYEDINDTPAYKLKE